MMFRRAIALALLLGVKPVLAADITLVTEEYPPFNMRDEGRIAGEVTDLLRKVFVEAGLSYSLEMLPWARAIARAEAEPGTCVFSTTRTPERETRFSWVGPLADNDWVLLAAKDSPIVLQSLKDARPYVIGGYVGDAQAQELQSRGFRVELTAQNALNPVKLEHGRIDLWACGARSGAFMAAQSGVHGLRQVLSYKRVELSLACNKETAPAMVERLRGALSAVRAQAEKRP